MRITNVLHLILIFNPDCNEKRVRKYFTICILLVLVINSSRVLAQEPLKARPSPLAITAARYKETYLKLTYSQPHKNGRDIFGKLVPYGKVWRLGANEATEITVTKDIQLNGSLLKAGTYSLFAIPMAEKWTIIVNADVGLWGSYNYNSARDVFRFDIPVTVNDLIFEPFTIKIDQRNDLADLLIYWDKIKVTIPIKFLN